MKKLMIAAAIVCASALSYGADAAPWKASIQAIYKANSTDTYSGNVYIIDAGQHAMSAVLTDWKNKVDVTAYKAGTIEAANGTAMNKTFNYGVGGNSYDLYAMVVLDDKIYFSNLLEDKTASSIATPTTLAFGTQSNGTSTFSKNAPKTEFAGGGYWYSAVPEPTSGLLLLLGVAGLALRRRRA